jgi:Prealbumin-like fold domain
VDGDRVERCGGSTPDWGEGEDSIQMAAFNFHKRQTRRWWYAGATLMAVAFFTVFFVVGAGATIAPSTFNANDGNLIQEATPAGNTDWCNQTATQLAALTPANVCPTGSLAPNLSQQTDLIKSTSDNAFGQGSKEDTPCPTVVFGSIPPQKSDLSRFYTAHEIVGGDTFLYLAWERSNILGNANMDFEFNQSKTLCSNEPTGNQVPVRTNGDLMVTYDFGGSGSPQLNLLFWLDGTSKDPVDGTTETVSQCFSANAFPCWGDHTSLSGNSEGAVNSTNVTDPINPNAPRTLIGDSSGGTFGEASIDLSQVLPTVFGPNPTTCESFGSAYLKSRSSSSFTAEQKDFVSPASVSLNNCGSLLIYKTDGTNGLAGATFTAVKGTTSGGSTAASSDFVDEGNGYYCLDNMLLGQSTVVTETKAPAGYNVDPNSQTITVTSSDSCATRLAANPIVADNASTPFVDTPQVGAIVITKTGKYKGCTTAGAAITVNSTQIGICGPTGSETTAKLGGAGFQLKTGSTVNYTSSTTTDPTTGTVCISGVAPGSYTLHESTTPTGYAAGADQTVTVSGNTTCAGTGTSAPATATVNDVPLTTITVSTTPQIGTSTSSTAYCVASTGGSSTGDTSGTTTPYTTSNAVQPGTYTCTVVIDP